MLNLKSKLRRFAALILLGVASLMSLSLGACSKQNKEAVVNPEQLNLVPYRKGKKWGYSDTNKKLIIEPKYDSAEPFSDGLARVQITSMFGYIDKKGNVVIPIKYGRDSDFSEDLVAVSDFQKKRQTGLHRQNRERSNPV